MDPKNLSKDWPGYNELRCLFVFGDSYSSVGFEPHQRPSEETPLGVEFPGDTWVDDKKPNWVGHLINKYYPKSPLLVYDYAFGGDNIHGLKRQVQRYRQPGSPGHPDSETCWQGNTSLFVTWIGFNDIVRPSLNIEAAIDVVFQLQEELYDTGARNFLFITTAPLPNASAGRRSRLQEREKRCRLWNEALTTRALNNFAEAHSDASIFIFDAWNVFEQMLTDPTNGDSYSSVGYKPHQKPTEEIPLGVEFPGDAGDLWVEDEKPNWVGYLINKYYPRSPLLVYNYAVGGDDINGLRRQVKRYRQPGSPGHPDFDECWQGNNSLFVTWIGFNDVANPGLNVQATIDALFQLQEELYDTGARNFLFMTTAPLPNASGGQRSLFQHREDRCRIWNETLTTQAQNNFAEAHPDASIFVFDARSVFEQMLTDPAKYGFSAKAGRGFDQEMYWDAIHPTTAVHRIVAKAVADFLAGDGVAEDQLERFSAPSKDT
ncbi:hypothetical protein M407DRAFT_30680 [Tulasnella calospora MUT 4182]|uniref:Carbohydrate esterase family 16 protein n=1 Tax=Tulasnella calospora MUT 4182 TaxID=1051891 RepID=A0A0C3Q7T8_9AGAM|nr:hypothetical protein M407DRAFT_30680 [Tulasnella calospora MUT 4182]